MPSNPQRNPFSILCEKCGYHLAGLSADDLCPECGRPARLSHPSQRQGTPWQQRMGPLSLLRTWWLVLRSPIRVWNSVRFDRAGRDVAMLAISIGAAAAAPLPGWIYVLLNEARPDEIGEVLLAGAVSIAFIILVACLFFAASFGVRSLHILLTGRRTSFPIIRAIGAHAASALTLAPIFAALATAAQLLAPPLGGFTEIAVALLSLLAIATPLLGVMTLVAIGNARLRYANRPPPPRARRHARQPGPAAAPTAPIAGREP